MVFCGGWHSTGTPDHLSQRMLEHPVLVVSNKHGCYGPHPQPEDSDVLTPVQWNQRNFRNTTRGVFTPRIPFNTEPTGDLDPAPFPDAPHACDGPIVWERIFPIVDAIWALLKVACLHAAEPDGILIFAESAGCSFATCLPLGCLLTLWNPVQGHFRSQSLKTPNHLGPTIRVERLILMMPYPAVNIEPIFRLGLWGQTRGLARTLSPLLPGDQELPLLPGNREKSVTGPTPVPVDPLALRLRPGKAPQLEALIHSPPEDMPAFRRWVAEEPPQYSAPLVPPALRSVVQGALMELVQFPHSDHTNLEMEFHNNKADTIVLTVVLVPPPAQAIIQEVYELHNSPPESPHQYSIFLWADCKNVGSHEVKSTQNINPCGTRLAALERPECWMGSLHGHEVNNPLPRLGAALGLDLGRDPLGSPWEPRP